MEFGITKCGMLVLKHSKIAKIEGIILLGVQVIKEIDNRQYMKHLRILESDQLKEMETKDVFSKEYKRRLKLVLKKAEWKEYNHGCQHMGSCNSKVNHQCSRLES